MTYTSRSPKMVLTWAKYFTFNILMMPVSIILFLVQDKDVHLYMVFAWAACALVGLYIREGILSDRLHSK